MEIRVPEQTINLSKEDLITMIMTTGVSFDAGNSSRMHNFPDGIIYEPSYSALGGILILNGENGVNCFF